MSHTTFNTTWRPYSTSDTQPQRSACGITHAAPAMDHITGIDAWLDKELKRFPVRRRSEVITPPLEHASPATRLLEKRRQIFEVQEALDRHKEEYAGKVACLSLEQLQHFSRRVPTEHPVTGAACPAVA